MPVDSEQDRRGGHIGCPYDRHAAKRSSLPHGCSAPGDQRRRGAQDAKVTGCLERTIIPAFPPPAHRRSAAWHHLRKVGRWHGDDTEHLSVPVGCSTCCEPPITSPHGTIGSSGADDAPPVTRVVQWRRQRRWQEGACSILTRLDPRLESVSHLRAHPTNTWRSPHPLSMRESIRPPPPSAPPDDPPPHATSHPPDERSVARARRDLRARRDARAVVAPLAVVEQRCHRQWRLSISSMSSSRR